jgi:5'-deoxynucleotidase YfbR-like HD superfamily hydrolase
MTGKIEAIQFAFEGGLVHRYHTIFRIREESVGLHSHGVAAIISILHADCSANLLKACIFHDLEEKVTGDMPADAKRKMQLRNIFKEYGKDVIKNAGIDMPPLTEWEEIRLKYADYIQGCLSCIYEMKAGNTHVSVPLKNFISYLNDMRPFLEKEEIQILDWICWQASYIISPEGKSIGR